MKVLVVEDNVSARKLLRITFEHYQCSVIEAEDGVEGLAMAGVHKPDIIISDALMPRMDGFQMLRALKADPALKAIPFIFYSSTYTGEKEEKLATSLGANAFVTKPAEPDTLWEKTREIMRDWETRQGRTVPPVIDENDEQYLKEYGRIVAAKLEEKVHELEEALRLKTQAEDALREQEAELATIFENAPFSMLLLDGDRRLRRVNGIACAFAGSSAADMIGERGGEALKCIHAMDVAEGCGFGPYCGECMIRQSVVDTFETGKSHQQVEKILTTCGTDNVERVRILRVSTIRVMVRNRPMVLLSLQDITEQRKLEDQLRQAQRIESIGTLAGGIAHDFNNVLTVIMGFGQVTMMSMDEGDPLRANMEQILAAAERASHLTKDLLLFGRKQVTDKKAADLNGVVKTVEKFLLRIVGENIACVVNLAEGTMPVFADAHQLEQVLVNLATNARDAMPTGGTFTIATTRTSLDGAFIDAHGFGGAGMYALLSVSDSGIGMDDETQQHVFDPFFTTKEAGKGTGLGMAVVYGIIKQHDGYIDICSEPGSGTTFNIYLPLIAPIEAAVSLEPELEPVVAGSETILLAENDQSVRDMMASVLRKYGYEVIVAIDGADAVTKFQENRQRVKLLLFDLVMPNKSGKEAYDEINLLEPGIKVVFASGNAPEIMRQKELLGDAVTVANKPFSPMLLLKTVRTALDEGSSTDMN